MKKPVAGRNLSPADTAFLYLERKEIPMHIASVCIFDGPIPFHEFVRSIEAKLHLVPRYRQVPVVPSWSLGFPTWEDDPHFDIHRHVIRARLEPPGGEKELQSFAGRILSQLLDRNRPLWDMHVVDGLKDGKGALIFRVHHALADGVSGTELMKVMLDPTPEIPKSLPVPRFRPRRHPTSERSLADEVFNTVNSALGSLLAFEAGVLDFAQALVGEKQQQQQQGDMKGLFRLLPELAASVERLPFNKPCTGERKFCWTEFSLADVQAIRESAGGTVNDVMLAVLTRALARYVKLHGQSVVNRFVRIVCPVSLRHGEQNEGLGNQISFLPVALPMDARGPIRMLQAVATRTEIMKRSGAAGLVGLAARWIAAAPPPLQALFWQGIPNVILPVPLFNLICTNVVGSPTPLYAMGRRMLAAYPQVPTGYDLGVGCAVHSYDGKLCFGLIADAQAAPDVNRLRDFLVLAFHELRRSTTMKKARSGQRAASLAPAQLRERAEPVEAATPELAKAEAQPSASQSAFETHAKEAA
jgi:diacylglycerol O-acyltransferase / wax synthase